MKIFVIYSQEGSNFSNDSIDILFVFKSEKMAREKLASLVDEARESSDFTKDYWISEAIDLIEE